jgi:hypothetical protein
MLCYERALLSCQDWKTCVHKCCICTCSNHTRVSIKTSKLMHASMNKYMNKWTTICIYNRICIYIYISERPGGPTSSQLPPRNPLAAAVYGNPHQHCALEREAKCLLDSFRKRWCQWFPWWHVVLLVNCHSQLWKITIFNR